MGRLIFVLKRRRPACINLGGKTMPINPATFLRFLARHYRPVEALCRQRARFTSDDEIAAFLQPYMEADISPARLISQMKEEGVLIPGTEDWSPPGFLARFLDELQNRHTLASPQVIQGWVFKLGGLVSQLEKVLAPATVSVEGLDLDALIFLLNEIDQTFRAIADTVHGNCDRIATEVAAYRTIEDAQHLRRRLTRLVSLHDEFLEPVIRIIDITGDFQAVTERIAISCAKLSTLAEPDEAPIGEESRRVRQEITWLRRSVIQRAEEAKRELGPLCDAAVRESRIAIGVNRALESIRQGQSERLELERFLPVLEDLDGTLMADASIERYLRVATQYRDQLPPELPAEEPGTLAAQWTARTLLSELNQLDAVDDLLTWLLKRCDGASADVAVSLLQSIIENRPDRAQPAVARHDYQIKHIRVDAQSWRWESAHGKP